ncbi:MAG: hypothetical protein ACI9P9_000717 [Patescibacteria group bacterium]|jgi:hypothetical protein
MHIYYLELFEKELFDLWWSTRHYESAENMFHHILKLIGKIKDIATIKYFQERIESIIKNAVDGYAHQDTLEELYIDFIEEIDIEPSEFA